MKINSGQAPSTLVPKYIGSDFDKVVDVATNIEDVKTVAKDIENVGIVADNIGAVNNTGNNIKDVTKVSDNIDYVKDVAQGIEGLPVISYIGDEPPKHPAVGASWYCTTDGRTYVWYEDIDSKQWVESSPQSVGDDKVRTDVVARASMERSLKLDGLTLVDGSFELGAVLNSATDVILHESVGKVYSWTGTFPATVPAGSTPSSTGGIGEGKWMSRFDPSLRVQVREVIRKSYAAIGYDLVDGSFERGGTVNAITDVLLYENTGIAYSWSGALPKSVDPDTTPAEIGWTRVGDVSLLGTYVTPEQYGAIGDGTIHLLSERFGTLAAAQAIYPHVTALTQTIDWAACQAADIESRAGKMVRPPRTAVYHFGSDYLELSVDSRWDSGYPAQNDPGMCPRMIRSVSAALPTFGQYCIVRVKDAAGVSADEFIRGVVFKGICLTYNLAKRVASKGTQRICLHLNYAINSKIDVSVQGGEWGVFGYSCWGGTGVILVESCHKGFYADPVTPTPENLNPPAGSMITTAFDYRVEMDACPFGITLRKCNYSRFTGFIEGALIGFPVYDSANETAVAITAVDCSNVQLLVGLEAWQGVNVYANGGNISVQESWVQQHLLTNTTGKQGAFYSMSQIKGVSDPHPIPSGDNCMHYALGVACVSVKELSGDFSNTNTQGTTYFCRVDPTARIVFDNCSVYFGANASRVAPGNFGNIEVVGGRYIADAITPAGYTKIGRNLFIKTAWGTKAVSGGDGRVQFAVGSDIPAGLKIHDVLARVIAVNSSNPLGVGVVSASDTTVTLQTAVTSTGFSVNWKAQVSWSS